MKCAVAGRRSMSRILRVVSVLWIAVLVTSGIGRLAAQETDIDSIRAREEFRWGVQAFHQGFYNEAILSLEKALTFRPDTALPRLWLGRALYMSGFEDAALAEWQSLIEEGEAGGFLQNLVEIITYRRGLGRELNQLERFVTALELDSEQNQQRIFRRPVSIRPRPDGSFFLTAFGSNEILVISPNGTVRQRLLDGLEGFDRPFDVYSPGTGFFFVSEYGANRIAKCTPQGNKILTFGTRGRGEGQLLGPQYLTADGDDYLYVSDWGNRRVVKFDFDGNYILSLGGRSAEYPGLLGPTGVLTGDGLVYVADRIRREIAVFDQSGNYIRSFGAGRLTGPEGLQWLSEGVILLADTDRVIALDVATDSIADITDLEGSGEKILTAALDVNGNLLVSDFDAGRVSILSELSSMYAGLYVQIDRIISDNFPEVIVEATVQDRLGNPVVGLASGNFLISEGRIPVEATEVVFSGYRTENVAVSLLVERSDEMLPFRELLGDVAGRAARELQSDDIMKIVSAGDVPVLDFSGTSLAQAVQAVREQGVYTDRWKFDLGLRLAASELIPDARKKEVVFLSSGILSDDDAFLEYGLGELLQYLKNNGISFSVVYLDAGSSGVDELRYLSRETGGREYFLSDPSGTSGLIQRIRRNPSGKYVLRYQSDAETDFGRNYIPMELEVNLIRKSGRDESGYFSPLQF